MGAREEYERAFGEIVGAGYVRAFGAARQGLVVLLKAMGVGTGDRVGVCGFSCVAVTEAVRMAGGTPAYLDTDEYVCIDPREIVRHGAGGLKVVILQHTFGCPGKLDELMAACRRTGARVVEDCAHVMGLKWKGTPLGSFGEGAIYSQGWGKPWELGRGGMVTVNSEEVLAKVDEEIERWGRRERMSAEAATAWERRFRSACPRAWEKMDTWLYLRGLRGELRWSGKFAPLRRGYVRVAGEMHCRAALRRIGEWGRIKARRIENGERVGEMLAETGFPRWEIPAEAETVLLSYPVRVKNKAAVMKTAQKERTHLLGYYESPVHPLWGEALREAGYEMGACPRAEKETDRIVHISTMAEDPGRSVALLVGAEREAGSRKYKV